MPEASLPPNERARLKSLRHLWINPDKDRAFDEIAELAAEIADAPIALVSLVDENRQWFKACVGLNVSQTQRSQSFCAHAILNPEQPLIVEDTTKDHRFSDNPLVLEHPAIRFYAGFPLRSPDDGLPIGTLCVIDDQPRQLDQKQIRMLTRLARNAESLIEFVHIKHSLHANQFAVDNSSDAVFWIREDGSFSYVNKQASEYLGYSVDDLRGMTVSDINPAYPIESWPAHWQEIKNRGVINLETSHRRKDGTRYDCEITKHFVAFDGQEFVFATARDITEKNKTRELYLQAQAAMDATADAIIFVSSEGRILYANDVTCQARGYTREEITKLSVPDIGPEVSDLEQFQKNVWPRVASASQSDPFVIERVHTRKDGTTFPVEVVAVPFEFNGQTVAVTSTRDISDRVEYRRQLEDLTHQLHLTLECGSVGLWDWDIVTNEAKYSEQWYRQIGEAPDANFSASDFHDRLHPDDLEVHQENIESLIAIEAPVSEEVFRLRHSDGEYHWFLSRGRFFYDETGAAIRATGVHTDITRQRAIQDALTESNEDLARFASAASHDLQEPLRAVSGFVQLLKKKYTDQLDETARGYIDKAADGAARMSQVIEDLLNFSKVGKGDLWQKQVKLNDSVKLAIKNLSAQIERTSTKIELSDLPECLGFPTLLAQFFQNMIGNAIKYSGDATPVVKIWCESTDQEHKIYIEDNGIGIDAEYHDQIFGLFKRLHHRKEYPGTGLGLAIVKRIVDRHQGTIHVQSELGKGTCFIVRLPIDTTQKYTR